MPKKKEKAPSIGAQVKENTADIKDLVELLKTKVSPGEDSEFSRALDKILEKKFK
jgi:hypothetical protein|tara:strand:- start:606 stop:770 length:165 start_codon:yes stop_codon:yes gene_type:complete